MLYTLILPEISSTKEEVSANSISFHEACVDEPILFAVVEPEQDASLN